MKVSGVLEETGLSWARLGYAWGVVGRGEKGGTNRVITRTHHTPITRDRDTRHAHIILGDQLMTTLVLAQIPDAHIPTPVAADQLPLVRVDHDIVHRHPVRVVPLHVPAPRVPDLDGPVLARRHEPLGLAVERDAGDVAGVAFKGKDRVRVR